MDVQEAQQGASHLALHSADGQPGGLTQDCPVPPCAPCKEGRFAGGSQSLRHCVLNSETESQRLRYVPLWPGSPWSSSGPQFPNFPPAALPIPHPQNCPKWWCLGHLGTLTQARAVLSCDMLCPLLWGTQGEQVKRRKGPHGLPQRGCPHTAYPVSTSPTPSQPASCLMDGRGSIWR